jgi:NAD(P)-dependent dehydrogenase (short-subunit alcohol dehydrogenase family)
MSGRLAVVTGASKGIGLAVAAELLAQGYEVVITGRDDERLAEATAELGHPQRLRPLRLDATDHVGTARELSALGPDILVANVGMSYNASITDTSLEGWNRVLDTNVTSAFSAIQAVLPSMRDRCWGRIVTIGSFASHRPIRFGVAYTASKHALLGLTRAAALDCRGSGVTVNMVAPAFVRTDMMVENARRIATATSRSVEEVEKQLGAISDLDRLIEPSEVAAEVVGLVNSDRTGELVIMGDAPIPDDPPAPTFRRA